MLYVVTACHSELGETMEASMLGEVRQPPPAQTPAAQKMLLWVDRPLESTEAQSYITRIYYPCSGVPHTESS